MDEWRTDSSNVTAGEEPDETDDEEKGLDHFSAVTVRGMLALPPATAGYFHAAFALGGWVAPGGWRHRIHSGQLAEASVVTKKRKAKVLSVLGKEASVWRRWVQAWGECRMAHRCKPDEVALFRRPSDACPVCGSLLPEARVEGKSGRETTTRWSRNDRVGAYITTTSRLPDDRFSSRIPTAQVLPATAKETAEEGKTAKNERKEKPMAAGPISEPVPEQDLEEPTPEAQREETRRKIDRLVERANRESPAQPWSRSVSACPECGGEAGCEPDCVSKPPLTTVEVTRKRGLE